MVTIRKTDILGKTLRDNGLTGKPHSKLRINDASVWAAGQIIKSHATVHLVAYCVEVPLNFFLNCNFQSINKFG
jgi:hypothetical protein